MKIEVANPPIIEAILKVFPGAADPGVVFAFGNVIYNPSGVVIPPAILTHEMIHGSRQLTWPRGGVQAWWDDYLANPVMRYHEELLSHAAEFDAQVPLLKGDRNRRAQLLMRTARRLIAPLYNYEGPMSLQMAMEDLKDRIHA